ncbi:hypothetical protein WBG78_07345, partial [Chryseolinea sp. T2]|uniref:hypothetical protein n=1 Tax=Chryseolinea sp. T2 TaxID=3129255 RepID=UPI003077025E
RQRGAPQAARSAAGMGDCSFAFPHFKFFCWLYEANVQGRRANKMQGRGCRSRISGTDDAFCALMGRERNSLSADYFLRITELSITSCHRLLLKGMQIDHQMMSFEEFENLALTLLNGEMEMTAQQRFAFVNFLGYEAEGPFRMRGMGRAFPHGNELLEAITHSFLRDDMHGVEYIAWMAFLGFDPFDLKCEANQERIKTLYQQVEFSHMIQKIAREVGG